MSTKTNYIGYKLITNIKKGDLLGYFLPSKISDLAYSIETLVQGPLKDKDLLLSLLPKSGGAIEFPFLSDGPAD